MQVHSSRLPAGGSAGPRGRNAGPPGTVLYLSMIASSPSHVAKFDGIRRYCSSRGWEAVAVSRDDASAAALPALLRRYRPVGCVVDGIARHGDLPPRFFRGVPVSYVGYPSDLAGNKPNFVFDPAAIAAAAFRDLSASRPAGYAVVGHPNPLLWSRRRAAAFRAAASAAGAKCLAFPSRAHFKPESGESFERRLAPWLAGLPDRCAVFAVSDEVAVRVARAARAAGRPIPRSLTLLSVDNFPELCERADPPISSIQLDFEREGWLAAAALSPNYRTRDGRPGAETSVLGPLFVVRRQSTGGRGRREPWILKAVETIRREACDGLTARDLAARFPGSRRLFEMRFREATGHSVLDEILHVRLEKAFALLAETDTAIGAVPALCGFRCNRTLDALFRSRTGLSMRDWRKRAR